MNVNLAALVTFFIFLSSAIAPIHAFAAGKKKKGRSKSVVGKGFGISKQPKLEDVVAKFHNRIPVNADECDCPCGSGSTYKACCKRFHTKEILPAQPLDVLRSRYTAFVFRLPLYILETTHPECGDFRNDKVAWVKDLNRDGMFDSYDFINLEAGAQEISADNDKEGFIAFRVNLRANANLGNHIEGQEIVVREKSRFLCSGDPASWTYAGGEVTSDIAGLEDVVLNN